MSATIATMAHQESTDDCRPSFSDWSEVLNRNVSSRDSIARILGRSEFCQARRQVVAAAVKFTQELCDTAATAGLKELSAIGSEGRHCDAPIIATGHQPVVFHPGLLAKNVRLGELVADRPDTTGLMVLIDTDEGDAGMLQFPSVVDCRLSINETSLSTGRSVYESQTIRDNASLAQIGLAVVSQLRKLGFDDSANLAREAFSQYGRLSGIAAPIANSIVRRLWEPNANYLEIPLSRLVSLPGISGFIAEQVENGVDLHRVYNRVLNNYRLDHNIANEANPFPNLHESRTSLELPFWILSADKRRRRVLTVRRDGTPETAAAGEIIVPRGMMITTILRTVVSDLFIHGSGGAQYDRCTDIFLREWLNIDAPEFVSNTSTQYLFDREMRQLQTARERKARIRDMKHRFQFHVDAATFPIRHQRTAQELLNARMHAVKRLRIARRQKQSARSVHEELKTINLAIDAFVNGALNAGGDEVEPAEEDARVLATRTFPFFFFDHRQNSQQEPMAGHRYPA